MTITKTHPIKSTLKKAIDYIYNPAKTAAYIEFDGPAKTPLIKVRT